MRRPYVGLGRANAVRPHVPRSPRRCGAPLGKHEVCPYAGLAVAGVVCLLSLAGRGLSEGRRVGLAVSPHPLGERRSPLRAVFAAEM